MKKITQDQFLNACVLAGCDYLHKVSNIDLEKCIDYVRKHNTLENTVMELKKIKSMYPYDRYQHIKDMYQFKTQCTAPIIEQHKNQHDDVTKKLQEFETFTEQEYDTLRKMLETNALPVATVRTLVRYFKECRNDFLLIRKNFFANNTNTELK